MSLTTEQIKQLADNSKLEADKLTEAIASETEAEIEFTKVNIFTDDELTEREKNLTDTVKSKHYAEGKVAGLEMAVDDEKKAYDLEFTGKSLKDLLEAHGAKIRTDAKIEPDKRVEELEKDKVTLQEKIDTNEADYQTKLKDKDLQITTSSTNQMIEDAIKELPKGLTRSDVRTIFQKEHSVTLGEANSVSISRNGQVLKDDKLNPKTLQVTINDFMTERQWLTGDKKGRGEGDYVPGSDTQLDVEFKQLQSRDELIAFAERHKLNPQGDEILNMATKLFTEEQRNKILFGRQ